MPKPLDALKDWPIRNYIQEDFFPLPKMFVRFSN